MDRRSGLFAMGDEVSCFIAIIRRITLAAVIPVLAATGVQAQLRGLGGAGPGIGSLGTPGLLREECLNGVCCTEVWHSPTRPFPPEVGFVSLYSRSDGLVDWRACLDPRAEAVEVQASHIGMAVNASVYRAVDTALRGFAVAGALASTAT